MKYEPIHQEKDELKMRQLTNLLSIKIIHELLILNIY